MRVQEINVPKRGERYIVVDDDGRPVLSILRYLKAQERDGMNKRRAKALAFDLCLFFTFIEQGHLDFLSIQRDDIQRFTSWLSTAGGQRRFLQHQVDLVLSTVRDFYFHQSTVSPSEASNIAQTINEIIRRRIFDQAVVGRNTIEPRTLAISQITALIDAADEQSEKVLMRLLIFSDLSVAEVVPLTVSDIDPISNEIAVRSRQRGTRCLKARTVTVTPVLMKHVSAYIADFGVRTQPDDPLFSARTVEDVEAMFRKIASRTGIDVTGFVKWVPRSRADR